MAIFHFPQFEHEPFWQYLSRFNDYRAQYVHFTYEQWEICDVVLEGVTHETRATLESMCGGICFLNADDLWALFESLAWSQWNHNSASESFEYPSPTFHDLHAYSPLQCSYCQSVDHVTNYCPYYDISDDCYANLNALIGTMDERLNFFVDTMRERDIMLETDPSPSSLRLEVNLYDDYESSLPLEPAFITPTPLTGLEKVIDPPYVAPSLSSTPSDTTGGVVGLLSSPIPLAQCTELEMGESSRSDASLIEDDLHVWSAHHGSLEPSFEECYDDDVRVSVTPSIDHVDPGFIESPTLVPISSPFLAATTPPWPAFLKPLGDFRGYTPSSDLCCVCLEDVPRKILWSPFFTHTSDFSLAFDVSTRTLLLFASLLYLFSYLHHSEMHAQAHDKLLRALMASELATHVLNADEEWLICSSRFPNLVLARCSLGTISTRPGILVLTLFPSLLFSFFFFFLLCFVVNIGLYFFSF